MKHIFIHRVNRHINRHFVQQTLVIHLLTTVAIFIACLLSAGYTLAQTITLNYKVKQGDEIGWLKLQKSDSSATTLITFNLEVKKRMILKFEIKEQQSATFQNGILMQSSVYRKVNDDIKVDKYTINKGTYYLVNEKESSAQVIINGIQFNQLSMYFQEPVKIKQVYSDIFQCLLNIENLENHSYKVKLPTGDIDYYYYTNGQCSKMKAVHSLFTVEFVLSK
jgi:hypothetical protein